MTTITPTVSLNILSEIPRFFTNTQAMLREIIQNSARAGATEIQVTATENTLTFKDNGRGLDQPQVLLTVAQSNWEGVVDPAGMGILSTLNPEWVSKVYFRSRNWIFSLTPEEFSKASTIKVFDDEPIDGFELQLTLKGNPFGDLEKALKNAKAINPITIIVNGTPLPPIEVQGTAIAIPEGTIYLRQNLTHSISGIPDVNEAPSYWEGFPTSSSLKNYILKHITRNTLDAYAVENIYISFVPDKNSGILPKLPDRNAFIENEAWKAAATHTFEIIKREVSNALSSIKFEDEIINVTEIKKMLCKKQDELYSPANLMQMFEYQLSQKGYYTYCQFDEKSNIECYNDPENDTIEPITEFAFASRITPNSVGDDEANALRLLARRIDGLPFQSGYSGPEEVRLQFNPKQQNGHIILGEALQYGENNLPWFVQEGFLLIAGDPNAAEATFKEWSKEMAAAFMYTQWLTDARETFEIYTESTFTNEDAIKFLQKDLNGFFPERQEAIKRRNSILNKIHNIQQLTQAINNLPEYTHILTPELLNKMDEEKIQLQKEASELTRQHHLS